MTPGPGQPTALEKGLKASRGVHDHLQGDTRLHGGLRRSISSTTGLLEAGPLPPQTPRCKVRMLSVQRRRKGMLGMWPLRNPADGGQRFRQSRRVVIVSMSFVFALAWTWGSGVASTSSGSHAVRAIVSSGRGAGRRAASTLARRTRQDGGTPRSDDMRADALCHAGSGR